MKNYRSYSDGKDIDTLWQVAEVLKPTPQWHHFIINRRGADSDDEANGTTTGTKKMLAIKNEESDSDDSMPPLQDVSDSDDSDWYSNDDDDDGADSGGEGTDSSGYDTDEEDEIREMLREAMDAAHEPDWPYAEGAPDDDVRKGNPFLKLLGSLRGMSICFYI